jgi:hypothetical protein
MQITSKQAIAFAAQVFLLASNKSIAVNKPELPWTFLSINVNNDDGSLVIQTPPDQPNFQSLSILLDGTSVK